MQSTDFDLIIVGGGIMGLMTAYYAAQFTNSIAIFEKRTIGNKYAASSGYSRSIRNDYLDPFYARLASVSQKIWRQLEKTAGRKFIVECGVLNVAQKQVTPDLTGTYAFNSWKILSRLGFSTKYYPDQTKLQKQFP